eukprot:scaffold9232_cov129-Isochrysis_galbana.AAC.5
MSAPLAHISLRTQSSRSSSVKVLGGVANLITFDCCDGRLPVAAHACQRTLTQIFQSRWGTRRIFSFALKHWSAISSFWANQTLCHRPNLVRQNSRIAGSKPIKAGAGAVNARPPSIHGPWHPSPVFIRSKKARPPLASQQPGVPLLRVPKLQLSHMDQNLWFRSRIMARHTSAFRLPVILVWGGEGGGSGGGGGGGGGRGGLGQRKLSAAAEHCPSEK